MGVSCRTYAGEVTVPHGLIGSLVRVELKNASTDFVQTKGWLSLKDHWQVDHLFSVGSDHAILKLQFTGLSNHKLSTKRWDSRFHFEEQWLWHEEYSEIIKSN